MLIGHNVKENSFHNPNVIVVNLMDLIGEKLLKRNTVELYEIMRSDPENIPSYEGIPEKYKEKNTALYSKEYYDFVSNLAKKSEEEALKELENVILEKKKSKSVRSFGFDAIRPAFAKVIQEELTK